MSSAATAATDAHLIVAEDLWRTYEMGAEQIHALRGVSFTIEIPCMSLLYWIVFGLVAGSIANYFSPSYSGGVLGSIVLGIIGAVVGGYFGEMFFGVGITGFDLRSFIIAVLGALLVLFVAGMMGRR